MRKFIISILGIISSLSFLSIAPIFAQGYIPSQIQTASVASNPNAIIGTIINVIFIIVGLIFFVMLVIAGIQWVTSGAAEDKKAEAQKRLINAIIGVAIVAAAYLVVEIVAGLLGVNFTSQKIFSSCSAGAAGGNTVCLNSSF